MLNIEKEIGKQVSYGVLAGGLFIALLLWNLSYQQQQETAFYEYNASIGYFEPF